jgi:hypothetical protein
MSSNCNSAIAVPTANGDAPARRLAIHARPRSAALARYRDPTPPDCADGLTCRQAAELERIQAHRGRTTWRLRRDGSLLVVVLGDRPLACDPPLYLVMRTDGSIAAAVRPQQPAGAAGHDDRD